MNTPLFKVVIAVAGTDKGTGIYGVTIIDDYNYPGKAIGQKSDMTSLDEAIEFAKGAVTTFMEGTQARD